MTYHLSRYIFKQFYLIIAQRNDWSNHDTLTSMNSQRVEIFHWYNREAMIVLVTYYLKLYFFPSFQALFNQNLLGKRKCAFTQCFKLLFILANPRA